MRNKLLIFVLGIMASVMMLFSCQLPAFPPIGGGGGGDAEYSRIVTESTELDLLDVRNSLSDIIGVILPISPDTEPEADGEIVFGNTNRAITAKAAAELAKELNKVEGKDLGYIIYSDGKNIAVYWNDGEMAEIAIPKFITICLSGNEINADKGIVATEFYNSGDLGRDKAWAKIEATADPEVYAALRELAAYYEGDKIAGWVANLYDPERGGFYYSISARDNEPFRPDLESTNQALGIMGSGGGGFNRNTDLSEKIKADIINFVKTKQSAKDGYFYHPQWPQDKALLQTDRYGRDMDWAVNLLGTITLDTDGDGVQEKQYPNYCVLASKCEKHENTDERCQFPVTELDAITATAAASGANLTGAVGSGVTFAVSRLRTATASVIATATVSDHPDYSSREAFKAWLYAYNDEESLRARSGNAHNLAALQNEIASKGMNDIVLDQLDEFQAKLFAEQDASGVTPTGCWQETADYQSVWGMYKYITTFYNDATVGRALNPIYIPYMVRTAITVIKSPLPSNKHMNDVMNQWTCIGEMITNTRRHNPDVTEEIFEILREDAVGIIDKTIEKITPFKVSDGSIGYSPTGNSLPTIYGVPISLGMVEGDTNAVNLCLSIYGTIFACMGYTKVPIMTRSDVEIFIDQIHKVEPIEKIERNVETIDFEGGEPDGFNWSPGDNGGRVEIVADPTNSSNNVLVIDSPVGTATSDRVKIPTLSLGTGCAIFEADIYVESCSNNNYMMQLYMSKAFMITLHKSGNNVVIKETPSDRDASTHYNLATVPMQKWFTLRVEFYSATMVGDGTEGVRAKIFVNGEHVATTDRYMYSNEGANPNTSYTGVELYSMRSSNNKIYFDNCYFASEIKTFDEKDNTISDARG